MVNYQCPRCGFSTTIKTKYTSHLSRKYICENKISDDNLETEYLKYNIQEKLSSGKYTQNIPIHTQKYTQNIPTYTQNIPIYTQKNTQNIPNNTDENECQYCKKKLSSYKNLWRHLKTCKEKIKDDEEKNELLQIVDMLNNQLKEQNEQINKRDQQIDELIKKSGMNIGTVNIQNNIKLLSYGNTDVSHLTDNDYMKCLNHNNFCVPQLIEKIHFNPQKPENHNIYISNIKNNYVMLYDGDKWILKDRDEAITRMIDEKDIILEQKLEEWIENGNEYPTIMNKFKRYIDKKENNKVLNKIKEEIKLILFNNRNVIEKNKN